MEQSNESEFVAFIGVDWADAKHDICLMEAGADKVEQEVLEHSPEAIDAWAKSLKKRFRGKPIAVSVELNKGPLVSALLKYRFFVIFPVNPGSLAKYRDTWSPSGAKDDPTDAYFILEVLLKHPDKLKRLEPQSPEMRALVKLVEDRRSLVDDGTKITNKITNALKNYYPQVLDLFDDKNTDVFCSFLERWPTPKEARRAHKATLERFFREHNVRYTKTIERRVKVIKSIVPLTEDKGVVLPNSLLVQSQVQHLRVVLEYIHAYDLEIERICKELSDYAIFESFPGAGPVYASRLLAAFGEDRNRYANASEVQRYVGIAPVRERSGNKDWVHWRYKCSKFLRQTFVEWAGQTIPKSFWAGVFYQQQRDKGSSHQIAIRALAFKWIRIMFRCWKEKTPYDESKYLKALQSRGSTLLNTFAKNTI